MTAQRIWFRRRHVGGLRRLRITPLNWRGWVLLAVMIACGLAIDFGAALLMVGDAYPGWSRVAVHVMLLLAILGIIVSVCWRLSDEDSDRMSGEDSDRMSDEDSSPSSESAD